MKKEQTSEFQESLYHLEQPGAPILIRKNPEIKEIFKTLPDQEADSGQVVKVDKDKFDTGKISEFPNLLDEYFDSYSIDDDSSHILLEKGLKLSDLGISDEESLGWQKISTKEMAVHCGDCVQFMMNNMEDEMVDATITSPPYDRLRTYEEYEFDFEATARELFRVTKPGGVVVWVVGDAVVEGSETGTSFRQALFFQEIGFNIHDTMIYEKTGVSFPSLGRYTQLFEYMFVFSKGKPKKFHPIKDVPKRWPGGSWGRTSRRKQDGTLDTKTIREGDGSGFKQRSNIWIIKNGHGFGTKDDIAYQHPATFPEQLANDHIITWSNPGDLIFDPMCGSGTTPKMALLNWSSKSRSAQKPYWSRLDRIDLTVWWLHSG